jgi:hypothetical protein
MIYILWVSSFKCVDQIPFIVSHFSESRVQNHECQTSKLWTTRCQSSGFSTKNVWVKVFLLPHIDSHILSAEPWTPAPGTQDSTQNVKNLKPICWVTLCRVPGNNVKHINPYILSAEPRTPAPGTRDSSPCEKYWSTYFKCWTPTPGTRDLEQCEAIQRYWFTHIECRTPNSGTRHSGLGPWDS